MERGTIIAKWLEIFYKNKIKPRQSFIRVLANPIVWIRRFVDKCKCTQPEAVSYFLSCTAYAERYKNEDWKPVLVEKGFSKILYEDEKLLVIFEGRPDLILETPSGELIPFDHKTTSRQYEIYPHNNQALAYCWACGGVKFGYNYIKFLSKSIDFYRQVSAFSPAQIKQWEERTIWWAKRIAEAINSAEFVPSLNCSNQFGKCSYTTICEATNDSIRAFVIKSQFKKNRYRSW